MLAESTGLTYTGQWVENRKHGMGVEKMPDGSVFEGPFVEGRRHGVGVLTTFVPVQPDDNMSWEMPDDDDWIKDWTVDKPELRGHRLKVRVCVVGVPWRGIVKDGLIQ